jgi:hypothetical protein
LAFLLTKSAFIHIPKTGGQWVVAALKGAGVPVRRLNVVHTSPDEVADNPEFQTRKEIFAFVRHPLSWYQSIWAHRMDDAWQPICSKQWFTQRWMNHWVEFNKYCQSNRFEEFVRKCVSHFPDGFLSSLYETYTKGCTFIGKQENIANDLQTILEKTGEDFNRFELKNTNRHNVRANQPRRQFAIKYTKELIDLIMKAEQRAVDKYQYYDIPNQRQSDIIYVLRSHIGHLLQVSKEKIRKTKWYSN